MPSGSCWRLSHCGGTQQIWIGSLCLGRGSWGAWESQCQPLHAPVFHIWSEGVCFVYPSQLQKLSDKRLFAFLQHTWMPWGSCCGAVDITESLLGQKKWICVTCVSRLQLIYLNKFSTFLPSCFLSASFSMELFQRMLSCFFPLFHSHCTPTDSQISLVNAYLTL